LEPRHPPLRSVAPCRGSLDSTLWNDDVNCRLSCASAAKWQRIGYPHCGEGDGGYLHHRIVPKQLSSRTM
jgi:hypothetical protein